MKLNLIFFQRRDLLTFSVSPSGSESEALLDINWSVVSPESVRDFEAAKKSDRNDDGEQRRSRMAPDGGNPLEESEK